MLASLGVPYVVGLDTLQDIAVQLGEVSGVTQAFQGLSDVPIFGQLSDGKIGELLASIDPRLLGAIGAALQFFNWYFDATDKIYTMACGIVHCCDTEAQ